MEDKKEFSEIEVSLIAQKVSKREKLLAEAKGQKDALTKIIMFFLVVSAICIWIPEKNQLYFSGTTSILLWAYLIIVNIGRRINALIELIGEENLLKGKS